MLYATAGVPVGVYDPTRLASMELGHWATDAGVGYTYLNEQVGFEWSAVVGLPERHRRTRGLGDFPVPHGKTAHRRRRLCVQPGDRRQRCKSRARRVQVTCCRGRAADRVFLSRRGSRRIPQSQRVFRVRRQEPARRMDRIRYVLRRGSGNTSQVNRARKARHVPALTAGIGRRAGFHPPRAIATPTSAAPMATIERPVVHGRNPAQRPNAYPHTIPLRS
jgi:hypothetical protein